MSTPCQQERTLSAYLDKALPRARMDLMRDHLRHCPKCRKKLETLQQTDDWIRVLPSMTPSPGFDAAFWAKVAQKETHRRPAWVPRLLMGWRPVLAAGLTAVLVAAFVLFRQGEPRPSAEEAFMVENMEMLGDFDLLQRLDLLENWDAIQAMREKGEQS